MKSLCPICRRSLEKSDERHAFCPVDGKHFHILYTKPSEELIPKTRIGSNAIKPVSVTPCVNHPNNRAVFRCKACQADICLLCEYPFGEGVSLCPSCVARQTVDIGAGRKKLLASSLFAAAIATLCAVAYIATQMLKGPDLFMPAYTIGVLSSTVGMGLAVATIERNVKNIAFAWVAIVWNAVLSIPLVIYTIYVLLT